MSPQSSSVENTLQAPPFEPWRLTGIGVLRIVFGIIWGIDAWLKWQPDFINNFVSYLTGPLASQPPQVRAWIHSGIKSSASTRAYLHIS